MEKKQKELIENCIALPVLKFSEKASRTGELTLSDDRQLIVQYEIFGDSVTISYEDKEQCLEIQKIPAFRGYKAFFVCKCGKLFKTLYLRPDGGDFACRICNELCYSTNRMDRSTVNGKIFSDFSRLMKLMEKRAAMRSIFYGGNFSRKFSSLIAESEKYGFGGWAREQKTVAEKIKMMSEVVERMKG